MPTLVTVSKWGNGIAVRIPREFAKRRKIKIGTVLDLDRIRVMKPRRRYKLSELLAQFKPAHRHRAWELGDRIGNEIW